MRSLAAFAVAFIISVAHAPWSLAADQIDMSRLQPVRWNPQFVRHNVVHFVNERQDDRNLKQSDMIALPRDPIIIIDVKDAPP